MELVVMRLCNGIEMLTTWNLVEGREGMWMIRQGPMIILMISIWLLVFLCKLEKKMCVCGWHMDKRVDEVVEKTHAGENGKRSHRELNDVINMRKDGNIWDIQSHDFKYFFVETIWWLIYLVFVSSLVLIFCFCGYSCFCFCKSNNACVFTFVVKFCFF